MLISPYDGPDDMCDRAMFYDENALIECLQTPMSWSYTVSNWASCTATGNMDGQLCIGNLKEVENP